MKTIIYSAVGLFLFLCALLSFQYYLLAHQLRHVLQARQRYVQYRKSLQGLMVSPFLEKKKFL